MEEDDVTEWELLPNDGFLQIHDDDDGKKIFSRRYAPYHNHLFVTNYFVFPSVRSSLNLPDPTQPEVLQSPSTAEVELPPFSAEPEDETVSYVSFKRLIARENEFADMKLDSPKSICNNGRTALPQIDLGALIQYELDDARETKTDHPKNNGGGGLTTWKWRGMCSFGVVAAAAFWLIVLGSQRKKKREGPKIQFQIFSDDKVQHKNSISIPVSNAVAHITFNLEC